ncbi:prolyl oligopeptidase family serine peptidase [Nocardia alba]|uniref:Prolyl oligopeptidase family protein n=1 Tax=Nocardia alba TaxID=225051 RepID=A0A4R1FWD5_9NOCA|nr:prolyl oligopeptidase family serine peptidase [Nocardia alba]TCJ95691.1 prolyl oligopeptidase family protein [Nocardia alba]
METITGTAAGVPFTALPPTGAADGPAPLIVTWHMLDAPRTDAAFAAALPMARVPAWRVHLGMPMCGARMVDGRVDAVIELIRKDPLMAFLAPFVYQAADEFPAALAALRDQLPVDDEPVGVLGGSLGGAVALEVLTTGQVPIKAVALVNPAARIRSAVEVIEAGFGQAYPWTAESRRAADELDYVARVAGGVRAQPPVLLVSGELDHPTFRTDATDLVTALREQYTHPDTVELATVPGLPHPLAEEPGLEPTPQLPSAEAVDEILTQWFLQRLTAGRGRPAR